MELLLLVLFCLKVEADEVELELLLVLRELKLLEENEPEEVDLRIAEDDSELLLLLDEGLLKVELV